MDARRSLYVGGAEHAVLHLLHARFWHKVLFDLGHVRHPEPFMKLVHQGTILGEDERKSNALRLYEMFTGPLEAVKPLRGRVQLARDATAAAARAAALAADGIAARLAGQAGQTFVHVPGQVVNLVVD